MGKKIRSKEGGGICGFGMLYIIRCLLSHFILSSFVGFLVYLSTSTILSHILNMGKQEEVVINACLLLASLSCALLAHILEDWLFDKF